MTVRAMGKIIAKLIKPMLLAAASDNKKKKKKENIIVELWRPMFGYAVSISWVLMMTTICYVVVVDSQNAGEIIAAFSETSSLWGAVLGVLGISFIKNNQAGEKKSSAKKTTREHQK